MPFLQANSKTRLQRQWCVLVVVLAVCCLTLNVATRYCSADASSTFAVRTLHKHAITTPARQRLTKDAATWIPPVVCSAVWCTPAFYPSIAPEEPSISRLSFEKSLYNRPPPSFKSLA